MGSGYEARELHQRRPPSHFPTDTDVDEAVVRTGLRRHLQPAAVVLAVGSGNHQHALLGSEVARTDSDERALEVAQCPDNRHQVQRHAAQL